MNHVAKLICHDDGEPAENGNWHLVVVRAGSPMLLCNGVFFGYGEGGARADTKKVARGGITCPDCLDQIREIKAIRL